MNADANPKSQIAPQSGVTAPNPNDTAQACCDTPPRVSALAKLEAPLKLLGLIGAAGFVAGLFLAPERIWPAFLVAVMYLVHLGVAALFFVAVQYVSKAGWSVLVRRIPEAMIPSLAWAALLAPMLLFGGHTLYAWTSPEAFTGAHAALATKRAWLNLPFFSARTVLYFVAWLVPAWLLVRNSRRQDRDGLLIHTERNIRISAIFIVLFALTFSAAAFDWLMSLEPEWYSTIFAAYVFSGMFLSGLAAMTILVIVARRKGMFDKKKFCDQASLRFDEIHGISPNESLISPAHLHDLGKLLFAFSCFWAYLWFCQFMLIWYTNMPEETVYFARRMRGGWQVFFWINVALNWIFPFFGLMSKKFKQSELILLLASLSILLGHWIDLYLMVTPVFSNAPLLGIWELVPTIGVAAVFALSTFSSLRRVPLIPTGDPLIQESIHHR